jgi:hypothetical protein
MKRKLNIKFRGFPWQTGDNWSIPAGAKFGWNPLKVIGMGRFGGGWAIKFGITISSKLDDWVFDLGIGSIRIQWRQS